MNQLSEELNEMPVNIHEYIRDIDVSIIIVNYNTKELTLECLKSIYQQTRDIEFEVIVSDNGSKDESIEAIRKEFPMVQIIRNNENLGFGKANNRGAAIAKGKYILYLNSDTILLNNAVKLFVDYWESHTMNRNLGCLGAQLINRQGEPIHSWGRYPNPNNTLKALIHMMIAPSLVRNMRSEQEKVLLEGVVIDGYITGADLFLLNDENAYYDERYFMYAEEADLEYNHFRLRQKECVLISGPRIVHLVGGSDCSKETGGYDFGKVSTIWLWLSNLKYLRKNHPESTIQIWLIKKILIYIWKKRKYIERTKPYLSQLEEV